MVVTKVDGGIEEMFKGTNLQLTNKKMKQKNKNKKHLLEI